MLTKEFREYRRKLNRLATTEFNKCAAETLTAIAKYGQLKQVKNLKREFTLRNKYTERSIRYWKASPKSQLWKINSVTGSISDYMELQEHGGQKKPKSGSRVPVATLRARGGKRTGVIRRKYYSGTLAKNLFIGTPGGRPLGIYERYGKNHKVKMIKNLEHKIVPIKAKHWHTNALKKYITETYIQNVFVSFAKKRLIPR